MPENNVKVKLSLEDQLTQNLKKIEGEFKSLGREVSEVSRTLTFFGGAVTASMAGVFNQAAKDMPEVNRQLTSISNSFQALADNVATAAAPSLNEFSRLLNGTVKVVSDFVKSHEVMVNQFIKYSAIALAVGTVGFAIGKLLKTLADLFVIGRKLLGLFLAMEAPMLAVVGAVLILIGALGLLDKAMGGYWTDKFLNFWTKMTNNFKSFVNSFKAGMDEIPVRSSNAFKKFEEGFQETIKRMEDSAKTLGASIGSSLETGFSNTFFNVLTGKFNDFKSVIIGFGNDIARAFSKFAAERVMFGLFNNDPTKGNNGIFSGLGGLLGFGKGPVQKGAGAKDPMDDMLKNAQKTSREFEKTTENLKRFQTTKDALMENFNKFGGVIQQTGSTEIAMTQQLGVAWTGMTNMVGKGFESAINTIQQAANNLLAMLGGTQKKSGGGWWKWLTPIAYAGLMTQAATFGQAGSSMTGIGGGPKIDSLPSGFNPDFGDIPFSDMSGMMPRLAKGGIVRRPTVAVVGESGPEAVVPLDKSGGMGGHKVNIYINEAVLNSPSNMKSFVKMLKEELAR